MPLTIEERVNIAQNILAQLGGNRFIKMTGVKNLLLNDSGVSFRLPSNFAKDKINHVEITLNGLDLYDVKFRKIRGTSIKVFHSIENVYGDQLVEIFENRTGLYTKF